MSSPGCSVSVACGTSASLLDAFVACPYWPRRNSISPQAASSTKVSEKLRIGLSTAILPMIALTRSLCAHRTGRDVAQSAHLILSPGTCGTLESGQMNLTQCQFPSGAGSCVLRVAGRATTLIAGSPARDANSAGQKRFTSAEQAVAYSICAIRRLTAIRTAGFTTAQPSSR